MEKISTHQFMTLGAAVLMGTTFLQIAATVTGVAGRDAWMSIVPGFAVAIPYGLMVLSLVERYPNKNLLQISEILLGKWVGKSIGVLYTLIAVYFGGLQVGQIGDIYERSSMPLMPATVFFLGELLLIICLIRAGIEVLARFSEVIFPIILVALVLNVCLAFPRIEQGELMPILSEGLMPLLKAGFKVADFAMEYILFLAGILTFLPTGKQNLYKLKTGVWRAVFLVGIIDMLVVLIQILVFGPIEVVRLDFSLLVLGKMVEISRTVEGIESLFLGVWLGALVIKGAAFFYMAAWGLETVFKWKGLKCNLAICLVFTGINYMFINGFLLNREIGLVDEYLILPFASIWIIVLWGVSRRVKGAGA